MKTEGRPHDEPFIKNRERLPFSPVGREQGIFAMFFYRLPKKNKNKRIQEEFFGYFR